jgi:hypothetical protein
MRLSLIAAMASLIVERAYYILARLLTLEDIDLWQAHPAPELLSLASAVAVWHVSVAALVATDMMSAPRRGRIALELGGMIALWCLISVVLW